MSHSNIDLPSEFKVRVYGLIEADKKFLLSFERFEYFEFWKFPGGGLELGETPIECLKRELNEELEIVEFNLKLYDVSQIFVQNRFNPKQQVIGIYYLVGLSGKSLEIINRKLTSKKKDGSVAIIERKWVALNKLDSFLTFEMDKEIGMLLNQKRL